MIVDVTSRGLGRASVQKIHVPEGNTIWIRFEIFDCEREYDWVKITDKDGTRLGFFDGEVNSDDDWRTKEMVSNADTVEVLFHTDRSDTRGGWRLNWGKFLSGNVNTGLYKVVQLLYLLYRNGWGEHAKVWSFDVSKLPLVLSGW